MSSRLNDRREAGALLRYLHDRGVMVWLDDSGDVNFSPASGLTETTREEIANLAEPLSELLEETTVIDPDAVMTNRTPPAPELSEPEKIDASIKASRRSYQNGMVIVNGQNNMGHYMRQLRRLREQQEAIEKGELPPDGMYRTNFDPFE
jgi:hypothetical protein